MMNHCKNRLLTWIYSVFFALQIVVTQLKYQKTKRQPLKTGVPRSKRRVGTYVKAFMKTKDNGENIYKMLKQLAEELQKYPCLYELGNKGYKERDQKESAWRAVEQFLIAFL